MLAGVVHEEYAYLTTTGRVSGTSHEIEIWFATDGSTVWLISGGDDRSDWVRNLLRDPRASVRIADVTVEVIARCAIADPAEREQAATRLYDKYSRQVSATAEQWTSDAYLVALDPV
jgi:deazaflavin-dependent oxidoreductase (nitroreductase family)